MGIVTRPGLLKRAGMEAVVVGLEWPAALARLAAVTGTLDREFAVDLLAAAEDGLCLAMQKKGT